MRSDAFRASVRPFLLRYTDHFMHEFYMYAISPYDMADFDRYAKYPSRPPGSRRSASTSPHSISRHNMARFVNIVYWYFVGSHIWLNTFLMFVGLVCTVDPFTPISLTCCQRSDMLSLIAIISCHMTPESDRR